MLSFDLKVGQALQIGDVACIAFDAKTGNRIKVRIATPQKHTISVIASGIIPRMFVRGLGTEPPKVLMPSEMVAA